MMFTIPLSGDSIVLGLEACRQERWGLELPQAESKFFFAAPLRWPSTVMWEDRAASVGGA
jgi:hypothetical protein